MSTWNSRTASWLKVARTAPTTGSLLSSPSTMMLFDRARWPVKDRPDVAEAPCCGVRSVVTPGVMTEKLMKLRPLIGRFWTCSWPTTVESAVWPASTTRVSAPTMMPSSTAATFMVSSSRADSPSTSTRPSRRRVAKPARSIVIE